MLEHRAWQFVEDIRDRTHTLYLWPKPSPPLICLTHIHSAWLWARCRKYKEQGRTLSFPLWILVPGEVGIDRQEYVHKYTSNCYCSSGVKEKYRG